MQGRLETNRKGEAMSKAVVEPLPSCLHEEGHLNRYLLAFTPAIVMLSSFPIPSFYSLTSFGKSFNRLLFFKTRLSCGRSLLLPQCRQMNPVCSL